MGYEVKLAHPGQFRLMRASGVLVITPDVHVPVSNEEALALKAVKQPDGKDKFVFSKEEEAEEPAPVEPEKAEVVPEEEIVEEEKAEVPEVSEEALAEKAEQLQEEADKKTPISGRRTSSAGRGSKAKTKGKKK